MRLISIPNGNDKVSGTGIIDEDGSKHFGPAWSGIHVLFAAVAVSARHSAVKSEMSAKGQFSAGSPRNGLGDKWYRTRVAEIHEPDATRRVPRNQGILRLDAAPRLVVPHETAGAAGSGRQWKEAEGNSTDLAGFVIFFAA